MSTVKDILAERAEIHGSYESRAVAISDIIDILVATHKVNNGGLRPPTLVITLWNDILLKLVRSAINTNHKDNWDDLAGYAYLIQELMGTPKEKK